MHLRTMSAAILFHEGRVLLMKRAAGRSFAPDIWAPVGGHVEPSEVNDPETTCLRELKEETGLTGADLEGLRMRYVLLRREADELRVHYFFSARARRADVEDRTSEGALHWVGPSALSELEMSFTFRAVLEHCLRNTRDSALYAAVTTEAEGEPQVQFLRLTDWRGMASLHLPH